LAGFTTVESIVVHLSFADRMRVDARLDGAAAPRILDAHHWSDNAFDHTMVLLKDAIQAVDLPELDGRFRSVFRASSAPYRNFRIPRS
jgi:hypothetical protein